MKTDNKGQGFIHGPHFFDAETTNGFTRPPDIDSGHLLKKNARRLGIDCHFWTKRRRERAQLSAHWVRTTQEETIPALENPGDSYDRCVLPRSRAVRPSWYNKWY